MDESVHRMYLSRGIPVSFVETLIHHQEIVYLIDITCILLKRYPDGIFKPHLSLVDGFQDREALELLGVNRGYQRSSPEYRLPFYALLLQSADLIQFTSTLRSRPNWTANEFRIAALANLTRTHESADDPTGDSVSFPLTNDQELAQSEYLATSLWNAFDVRRHSVEHLYKWLLPEPTHVHTFCTCIGFETTTQLIEKINSIRQFIFKTANAALHYRLVFTLLVYHLQPIEISNGVAHPIPSCKAISSPSQHSPEDSSAIQSHGTSSTVSQMEMDPSTSAGELLGPSTSSSPPSPLLQTISVDPIFFPLIIANIAYYFSLYRYIPLITSTHETVVRLQRLSKTSEELRSRYSTQLASAQFRLELMNARYTSTICLVACYLYLFGWKYWPYQFYILLLYTPRPPVLSADITLHSYSTLTSSDDDGSYTSQHDDLASQNNYQNEQQSKSKRLSKGSDSLFNHTLNTLPPSFSSKTMLLLGHEHAFISVLETEWPSFLAGVRNQFNFQEGTTHMWLQQEHVNKFLQTQTTPSSAGARLHAMPRGKSPSTLSITRYAKSRNPKPSPRVLSLEQLFTEHHSTYTSVSYQQLLNLVAPHDISRVGCVFNLNETCPPSAWRETLIKLGLKVCTAPPFGADPSQPQQPNQPPLVSDSTSQATLPRYNPHCLMIRSFLRNNLTSACDSYMADHNMTFQTIPIQLVAEIVGDVISTDYTSVSTLKHVIDHYGCLIDFRTCSLSVVKHMWDHNALMFSPFTMLLAGDVLSISMTIEKMEFLQSLLAIQQRSARFSPPQPLIMPSVMIEFITKCSRVYRLCPVEPTACHIEQGMIHQHDNHNPQQTPPLLGRISQPEQHPPRHTDTAVLQQQAIYELIVRLLSTFYATTPLIDLSKPQQHELFLELFTNIISAEPYHTHLAQIIRHRAIHACSEAYASSLKHNHVDQLHTRHPASEISPDDPQQSTLQSSLLYNRYNAQCSMRFHTFLSIISLIFKSIVTLPSHVVSFQKNNPMMFTQILRYCVEIRALHLIAYLQKLHAFSLPMKAMLFMTVPPMGLQPCELRYELPLLLQSHLYNSQATPISSSLQSSTTSPSIPPSNADADGEPANPDNATDHHQPTIPHSILPPVKGWVLTDDDNIEELDVLQRNALRAMISGKGTTEPDGMHSPGANNDQFHEYYNYFIQSPVASNLPRLMQSVAQYYSHHGIASLPQSLNHPQSAAIDMVLDTMVSTIQKSYQLTEMSVLLHRALLQQRYGTVHWCDLMVYCLQTLGTAPIYSWILDGDQCYGESRPSQTSNLTAQTDNQSSQTPMMRLDYLYKYSLITNNLLFIHILEHMFPFYPFRTSHLTLHALQPSIAPTSPHDVQAQYLLILHLLERSNIDSAPLLQREPLAVNKLQLAINASAIETRLQEGLRSDEQDRTQYSGAPIDTSMVPTPQIFLYLHLVNSAIQSYTTSQSKERCPSHLYAAQLAQLATIVSIVTHRLPPYAVMHLTTWASSNPSLCSDILMQFLRCYETTTALAPNHGAVSPTEISRRWWIMQHGRFQTIASSIRSQFQFHSQHQPTTVNSNNNNNKDDISLRTRQVRIDNYTTILSQSSAHIRQQNITNQLQHNLESLLTDEFMFILQQTQLTHMSSSTTAAINALQREINLLSQRNDLQHPVTPQMSPSEKNDNHGNHATNSLTTTLLGSYTPIIAGTAALIAVFGFIIHRTRHD